MSEYTRDDLINSINSIANNSIFDVLYERLDKLGVIEKESNSNKELSETVLKYKFLKHLSKFNKKDLIKISELLTVNEKFNKMLAKCSKKGINSKRFSNLLYKYNDLFKYLNENYLVGDIENIVNYTINQISDRIIGEV